MLKNLKYRLLTTSFMALAAFAVATPAVAVDKDVTGDVHRPSPNSRQYLSEAMRDAQNNDLDNWVEKKFEQIDTDANGLISGQEHKIFHDAKFAEIDADANGSLSRAEIKTKYEAVNAKHDFFAANNEHVLDRKFNEIDRNHDNAISKGEYVAFFDQTFGETDANKDGSLSKAEVFEKYRAKRDQNSRPMQ